MNQIQRQNTKKNLNFCGFITFIINLTLFLFFFLNVLMIAVAGTSARPRTFKKVR